MNQSYNDKQVIDSYSTNSRISARISFVHSPVVFVVGVVFLLVAFIGAFIFGSYVISHWKTYLGQTAAWVNWCIWFIAATGTVGLIYVAIRVANSGAEAIGQIGYTCIDIYRSISEAKGQRERNKLLHAGDNYVVHICKGEVIVTPVIQEKVVNTYRHAALPEGARESEETPHLPSYVRYEEVKPFIPRDHALVGVGAAGPVSRERDDIRGLTWIVGSSNTGKTNTLSLRVAEDIERAHCLLVVDPHMFKQDSLYHAIAHYERQFLYPIASKLEAIEAILDYYLQEAERRMAGHAWDYPVTLLIDEVSHLTSFLETEQEKRIAAKLKEVARFSGQEARGFDLCAVFISQTATGLSWLRKNASMVIAHQTQAMSERLLVCNQDRTIARAMDNWPKGRTCIYGIGIEEGPSIYQQPVIRGVPGRSSFEEQYRNSEEQPEEPEEHYFDDVPERSWEQAGTQKKVSGERERIIALAKRGIARRDICKELGKGKYFYETVKEVLDEEGL